MTTTVEPTGLTDLAQNIGPLAEHFRVPAVDVPDRGGSDTQLVTSFVGG